MLIWLQSTPSVTNYSLSHVMCVCNHHWTQPYSEGMDIIWLLILQGSWGGVFPVKKMLRLGKMIITVSLASSDRSTRLMCSTEFSSFLLLTLWGNKGLPKWKPFLYTILAGHYFHSTLSCGERGRTTFIL